MFILLVAFGVLAVFAIVSLLIGHGPSARTKQTCETLHQKCAQNVALSEQDNNPMVRLMHATTAVAYSDVLSVMVTDENQKSVLGVNPYELKEEAQRAQKNALVEVQKRAPALQVARPSLAVTAGWKQ